MELNAAGKKWAKNILINFHVASTYTKTIQLIDANNSMASKNAN